MPKIKVNNRIVTNGQLVIKIEDIDDDASRRIIGQFITHGNYEMIDSLESDRYYVGDISIKRRIYDANEFNIVYEFTADEFEVKGGISNIDIDVINKIEDYIYEEDLDVTIENYKKEVEKERG